MIEAARICDGCIEGAFARVPEWRMSEIVRQGDSLSQVLIDTERPRNAACDLRDLETVCETRAVMIALVIDEDLGLVVQAAKRGRMQDAVAVARVRTANGIWRLGKPPSAAIADILGKRRKPAIGRLGSKFGEHLTGCGSLPQSRLLCGFVD